jgi:hypothetical protein
MSVKWQRNYVLTVQLVDGSIETIQYPLTLEFYIRRQNWSSTNEAQFRIYNLNQKSRTGIRRDWQDFTDYRSLKLQAGYGPPPYPTIFNGNMFEAESWRDSGSPNFITQMTGKDYIFSTVTGIVNTTLAAGVSKNKVVETLSNAVINAPSTLGGSSGSTGLGIGYVTNAYNGMTYPRGRVLFGNAWQILQQETGNSCYIDNGNLNILQNNDVFVGGIPTIDSSTGLLSTPKKREAFLDIEILFEPNIQIGQMINLQSVSEPDFNGNYKVVGLEHRGIISGSVNGKCTTKLTLFTLTQYNQISEQGF